jgi:hypothetical protein
LIFFIKWTSISYIHEIVFNNSFRKEVDFTLDSFEIKIVTENVSYFRKAPSKICESNPFFTQGKAKFKFSYASKKLSTIFYII